MSTEVGNTGGGAVSSAAAFAARMRKGIQNVRQAVPASQVEPILRLGKDGLWVYGQENIEVQEGSLWAVNVVDIQHGFTCWSSSDDDGVKNELLGEVYASMLSAPIDKASLPDHGFPWRAATVVHLKCTNGDDVGVQVVYKPSSMGGANVMQTLLDKLDSQLDKGVGEIFPVVDLGFDHYMHKKWGKTYVPVFDIDHWVAMDASPTVPAVETAAPEKEPEPVEEVKKPRGRARKAAAAPVQEFAEEARAEAEDLVETPEVAEAETAPPRTEGRTRRRRRS